MTRMHKQSAKRRRLAQHLEDRRVELGLRWADVAEGAGLTTETLRQIRSGDGDLRPLTRRGIEDALRWTRGSIQSVLAGGDPIPTGEGTLTPEVAPIMGASDIQTSRIREVLASDTSLLEEAKAHLLNQYELLRRIAPAEPSEQSGTDGERRAVSPSERPLKAVADRGSPSDRAEMERRAREIRKQHPRKNAGTRKDDE